MNVIKRMLASATIMMWVNFSSKFAQIVLVIPFVLINLQPEFVSIWFLFLTINNLSIMAQFGLGPTLIRYYSYALTSSQKAMSLMELPDKTPTMDNKELLANLEGVARVVYRNLAVLLFFLLAVFGSLALFKPINYIDQPMVVWWLWAGVLLSNVIILNALKYVSFLHGVGKIAQHQSWLSIANVLGSIVLFVLGIANVSFAVLVVTYQVILLLTAVGNYYLYIRARNVLQLPKGNYSKPLFNSVWRSSWRSGLGVLFSDILVRCLSFFVANVEKPNSAASFSLSMYIMQTIQKFSLPPFYSKIPKFAQLHAQAKLVKHIPEMSKSITLSLLVVAFGFAGVGVFAEEILNFFGSNVQIVPGEIWALFFIGVLFERIGAMHIQIYTLSNDIIWHKANGLAGILFILSSLILYPNLGLQGLGLAYLVCNGMIYCLYSTMHSYRFLNLSFVKFDLPSIAIPSLILIAFLGKVWLS